MAAPAALAGVGIFSSILGGITQAKGAEVAAQGQEQLYGYQAAVSKLNAQIDLQNADYARSKGEQEATIAGMKGAQTLGQIKVGQAASGFDVNKGSTVDVQESQKKVTAIDLAQIRQNAAKTAYDYDVKSTMDVNQAGIYQISSANVAAAVPYQVASSILGSASSVSSQWLKASQAGVFS